MTSYKLTAEEGRLVVRGSDGSVVPWTCYSVSSETDLASWQAKQHTFLRAGVHLFQICAWGAPGNYWHSAFWSLDGKPVTEPRAPMTLGDQAQWLLSQDPQARFVVRFRCSPDPLWRAQHENDFPRLARRRVPAQDGNLAVNASTASDAATRANDRLMRDVVAWCERQPWRDRVVGYSVFPYCEGLTERSLAGRYFDNSPVMAAAFRRYVREKYASDAELRRAWNDRRASLKKVATPTEEEWLEKRRRLDLLHWPDPADVQRERDYFLLQKKLFHRYCRTLFTAMEEATAARPVVKGYDLLKQPMQGWMHDPEFFGHWRPDEQDHYSEALLASGSIGVAPLLDHPGLDTLQTPGLYFNRALGCAWDAEGLTDTLALRGKLNFMEADMRTWVSRSPGGRRLREAVNNAGVFMTPAEMRAGFDRTLAWALSRNQMFYYMSVCGRDWWYDHPEVERTIAAQAKIVARSARLPWRETENALCVVIDDEASLYEDFSAPFQNVAVRRQIDDEVAVCGVPYRIHLLPDLGRDDFPDYRCYFFPNLFKIDAATLRLLRRKVLGHGRVAIFGPGTGVTDGKRLTADIASRLLGVKMELIPQNVPRRTILQDHGHPISRRLPALTFGHSQPFGPLLVPAAHRFGKGRAVSLGATFTHYMFERPGLFVRDFGRGGGGRGPGDYAVVFSAAIPLPADLLRECYRYAGGHVWTDERAVVYAAENFVALHTASSGPVTIHLPRRCDVTDLQTGRRHGKGKTDTIRLRLKAPATRMFRLD